MATQPTLGDLIDALYDQVKTTHLATYRHTYPTPEGAHLTQMCLRAAQKLCYAVQSSNGTNRADALHDALVAVGHAIRANALLGDE